MSPTSKAIKESFVRFVQTAMIAVLAMALGACDSIAELGGPTDRFVLQADSEALERLVDSGEQAEDPLNASGEVIERRLDLLGMHTPTCLLSFCSSMRKAAGNLQQ